MYPPPLTPAPQLLATAAAGGDAALCCFGQTGSGKSFSMGALLTAAGELLLGPGGLAARRRLRVTLSAYEVAGPAAFDLLAGRAKLRVREDAGGQVTTDATRAPVGSPCELASLLAAAGRARKTAATARNPGSSR